MSDGGVASRVSGLLASLEGAGLPVADLKTKAAQTRTKAGESGTKVSALVGTRPELGVAGAFAGGLTAALILRRLGR